MIEGTEGAFNMKRIFYILLMSVMTLFLIAGCGSESKGANVKVHTICDSVGRNVEIPYPVTKAAVANAYNVELINAIGALDNVVGVDFNIYNDQAGFKNKFKKEQIIGKNQRELNYEKIIEINPQVLILTGNGALEEAEKKLKPFGIKVIVCDSYYTEDFEKNCKLIGSIFGKEKAADELTAYFMDKLAYINKQLAGVEKKKVYFEYRRIGSTTIPGNYFYKMIEYAGGANIFSDAKNVNVDPESIIERNPEYIIKVSNVNVQSTYEPPTADEQKAILAEIKNRPGWDSIDAVKNNKILLLSHYVHGGASKLVGTMYVAKYLYPDKLPDLHPEQVFKDWLEKYQHLSYIEGHTYPKFNLND